MSPKVYGLLLCWYSVLRQPGPQPIEKLKLKIITYAQLYSLAGTKADSEPNEENIFVSQHSSKPPVICRRSSLTGKLNRFLNIFLY